MVSFPKIDKVQLHANINSFEVFKQLLSCHMDTAEINGVFSHEIKNGVLGSLYGRRMTLSVNGSRLECGVFSQCGRWWMMYRFNGVIDHGLASAMTQYFPPPYDLSSTMIHGRVKVLELARDIVGFKAKDLIFHHIGAKTGMVCHNESKNGYTYYSGSRHSREQLTVYDKSQQLIDTGKPAPFSELLRIEFKTQNRLESLGDVVSDLLKSDPMQKIVVVKRSDALSLSTSIKDWPLFVSSCGAIGVAKSLRLFKKHRKTFMSYLTSLSLPAFRPTAKAFRSQLQSLLPEPILWALVDGKIIIDRQTGELVFVT